MRKHPFHLVDPSPWPLFASFSFFDNCRWCNVYAFLSGWRTCFILWFIMLLYSMFVWWRDVIRESTFEGHHTSPVQARSSLWNDFIYCF